MSPLIAALQDPAAYPHPAPAPRLIETHISWVILAGDYAYKIKKPLDLGFLDFSSLDKREFCCREEIRLNRRLAQDTYLGVVAISGSPPRIGGSGTVLEWAVKMRAFPAESTLDREVEVTTEQIDAIADRVARFHQEIAAVPVESDFGSVAAIHAPMAENFRQLRAIRPEGKAWIEDGDALLARLEAWSEAEGLRLSSHFIGRKQQGYIRECHGDLHLGNIAWVSEVRSPPQEGDRVREPREAAAAPLIFDGIDFNPGLRCIDVISEVAFLCMDLAHRGRTPLAWRFLNRYLEHGGDYSGLAALPYYLVYRAMVRAKVAAIRASQENADFSAALSYLQLAHHFTQGAGPAMVLMHGVSGSGKTSMSQALLEGLSVPVPTIRLRADVERKRLFGLNALADSRAQGKDLYSREAGERTLARLLALTHGLLADGFPVIVDATFIKRDWRTSFERLARAHALPWCIAALQTSPEESQRRVSRRQATGLDASEAGLEVLAAQLAAIEPFAADERPHVVYLDDDPDRALEQIRACHAALPSQP